jgi:N-acetylglucosamine-6-phosphate deacetylase
MDMAGSVRNAIDLLGVTLPDAVRMASEHPAAFLGLASEMGSISAGRRADLVVADEQLNVLATWIGGQMAP